MQHHADAVPELLQGIVPNIQPVQQDRASGDVIEPGDQIDQRGLARPRAAHDGHKLAGLHGEADLREYIVSRPGAGVFEGDVPELHPASGRWELVLGGALRLGLVFHRGLRGEDLIDPVGAGLGAGELKQGHSHHHHAYQDLENIVDERLEVAQQEALGHHHLSAQVQHGHGGPVHRQHHNGHDGNDLHAHVQPGHHQLVVGALEFFPLVVLPDEGLDHPDGHQVLLQCVVQAVDLGLHHLKELGADLHQNADGQDHQRDDHQQHYSQPGIDGNADPQGGNEHHRDPHQHPQAHIQHHGHGVDVVGHAGDEGGRGEAVDVREGELLYLIKEALAQVGAEALAGKGGVFGGEHAEGHGQQGEGQHDRSQPEDIGRIPGGDGDVHDLCHDQWQDQFADDLQGDKDRGAHCLPLIALEMGDE